MEAPFLTLAILRLICIIPSISYYRRIGKHRFIYMILGWLVWGFSPLFHLLEPYHSIFTLLYGFTALLGTYLIIASIFREFTSFKIRNINIGAIFITLPFLSSYFIAPESFFVLLTILQAALIQLGLLLGIVFNKKIRKIGGNLSFSWFILLGAVSIAQIMMFISLQDFGSSYYAFGINYLIIFLIKFFIISVEQNIILNQIQIKTQKLSQKEHRFRALVESSSDLIWEIDKTGQYIYMSKKIYDLLGYTQEEVIGRDPTFCMRPEEAIRVTNFVKSIFETQKPFMHFENVNTHKDGRNIILETSGVPVFDENKNFIGYRGVDRDVTELKAIQSKLILGQKMEAIGRFAGGIAHDFNNLLTIIIGLSDQMSDEFREEIHDLAQKRTQDDDVMKIQKQIATDLKNWDGDIADIKKAGKRAAELTRQLLAFSRKQILNPKVMNINEIIRNMDTMLRRLVSEDISFKIQYGNPLGNICCDPNQMEQVIMNLVLNARDSMPKGGKLIIETSNILVTSEFSIADVKSGSYIQIAVSDSGFGMSKEQLSHLFEPFYTTKEVGKGTGLGLSTVYGIVKQSNGEISVYSNPMEGTTFKVFFPTTNQPLSEKILSKTYSAEELKGNETILLVEDEDSLRKFIHGILKSYGYDILSANNPNSALEVLRNNNKKIHMLLSDVIMPGMTGKELSEIVLKELPETRVIFMSGYTEKAIVERGILIEGINFLQKPFSSADLLVKVKEILKGG